MLLWKHVQNYEGRYKVSDTGLVYSVRKNRVLRPCTNHGYKCVLLTSVDAKRTLKYVHRLVAEAFIPNPENLPCVNHKDEDKSNNNVNNLEWCSWSYNNNYNNLNIRRGLSNRGKPSPKRIPIIDVNTNTVYKSLLEANNSIPIHYSKIKNMVEGSLDEYKGYRLRYFSP